MIRDLYGWVRKRPELKIEFGAGKKIGSFRVKLLSPSAPRETVLGVYTTGQIWPGFPTALGKEAIRRYRFALSKLPGAEEAALTNQWFYFQMKDASELEIIKQALSDLTDRSKKTVCCLPSPTEQVLLALSAENRRWEPVSVDLGELNYKPFASESEFAAFLWNHPDLIKEGLSPIVCDPRGTGGPDLILLERNGNRHIAELKCGRLDVGAVGQVVSYGAVYSWRLPLKKYSIMPQIVESNRALLEEYPDKNASFPSLYVIAGQRKRMPEISPTARACIYTLRKFSGIDIKALTISRAELDGKLVVHRGIVRPTIDDIFHIRSWSKID
jgi:hypothetical protein